MIDINLLPENMRRRDSLPSGQRMALIILVLLFLGLAYFNMRYYMVTVPELQRKVASLAARKKKYEADVKRLEGLEKEISRMSGYVNAVKDLYRNRVVWSKVLSDMKQIVNFDAMMSRVNSEQRYLWLTRLDGKGKEINLEGFATASSQVIAMRMPERLLHGFREFSPVNLPEKDEEERLQKELGMAIAQHEAERREKPELPIQGPREIGIRQRLEEIKNVKSGGVALQPFHELLVPSSLQLKKAAWTKAPRPRLTTREQILENVDVLFPENAWNFTITMTLK